MINEPTAAALSYEAGHRSDRRVLVYDLGGGTFDVSVVSMAEDVVEVIASHGNNHLGGDDFDQKLLDHAAAHLEAEHELKIGDEHRVQARFIRAAERAKIALTDQPYAAIEEEYIAEQKGAPVNFSLEVSRDDYEAMIASFIDETLDAVHLALKDASLTVSDIDDILLVGGATRTPLVGHRLEEEFRRAPRAAVHPDLCVAMGAAIQAQIIAGGEAPAVLVDVTPYTFGTSAVGEVDGVFSTDMFVPIIHRNTPIPVNKTEVFFTMIDNQDAVDCKIYQGEDPNALNDIEIGRFMVTGLSHAPAGNPILVRLELDLDGILHVSAREKETGRERSITIDSAISRFEEGEMEKAKERIEALFGEHGGGATHGTHRRTGAETGATTDHQHAAVQARAVVEKAERMLEDAVPEDREDMVNLIEAVNDALTTQDLATLKKAVDELSDIIYYLES